MNIRTETAADSQTALDHFEKLLSLKTDGREVQGALASGAPWPERRKSSAARKAGKLKASPWKKKPRFHEIPFQALTA
jgi:hypothetical protein